MRHGCLTTGSAKGSSADAIQWNGEVRLVPGWSLTAVVEAAYQGAEMKHSLWMPTSGSPNMALLHGNPPGGLRRSVNAPSRR
jgi:hypothetical protein